MVMMSRVIMTARYFMNSIIIIIIVIIIVIIVIIIIIIIAVVITTKGIGREVAPAADQERQALVLLWEKIRFFSARGEKRRVFCARGKVYLDGEIHDVGVLRY